jgi:hypothetical protein
VAIEKQMNEFCNDFHAVNKLAMLLYQTSGAESINITEHLCLKTLMNIALSNSC